MRVPSDRGYAGCTQLTHNAIQSSLPTRNRYTAGLRFRFSGDFCQPSVTKVANTLLELLQNQSGQLNIHLRRRCRDAAFKRLTRSTQSSVITICSKPRSRPQARRTGFQHARRRRSIRHLAGDEHKAVGLNGVAEGRDGRVCLKLVGACRVAGVIRNYSKDFSSGVIFLTLGPAGPSLTSAR
jgi:hypothetical protein